MNILVEIEKARELKKMALSFDDVGAKLIHARDIVIDKRVRFQCSHSGCREYNRRLMCPPHTLDVDEFRRVLSCYYIALMVQLKGDVKNKDNWEVETDHWALRLHDIIYKLEKKAFALGFPFSAGLIGGSCKLCNECPGEKESNAKCLYAEKARPSMEAMGIDVLTTCKKVDMKVEFSPEEVIWTGLVLLA